MVTIQTSHHKGATSTKHVQVQIIKTYRLPSPLLCFPLSFFLSLSLSPSLSLSLSPLSLLPPHPFPPSLTPCISILTNQQMFQMPNRYCTYCEVCSSVHHYWQLWLLLQQYVGLCPSYLHFFHCTLKIGR